MATDVAPLQSHRGDILNRDEYSKTKKLPAAMAGFMEQRVLFA